MHLRFAAKVGWSGNSFRHGLRSSVTRVDGATYRALRPRKASRVGVSDVAAASVARHRRGNGGPVRGRPAANDAIRTTITEWQLSRAEEASGDTAWTHVFEQRFTDEAGLTGPYLMHPIHWAYVDRWFDPECPDVIVRDRVCHSFCQSDAADCGLADSWHALRSWF